jgi:hypothetical protein
MSQMQAPIPPMSSPSCTTTFQAWGTAVNSFPGPTGWPEMVPMREIPALAPGETYVFRPGGDQASFTNTWVKIYLDINHHIDELDETNNLVDKKL